MIAATALVANDTDLDGDNLSVTEVGTTSSAGGPQGNFICGG
jgi:hypothetical protein